MKNNTTMKSMSSENQQVNSTRAMYYALCDMGGILTPTERKIARKSSPVQERRSSKPKKGAATNLDMLNLLFEKSPAKVFYVGKKSDLIASAEPVDRTHTVVMINGVPHKKDGNGGYKALTLQSTTETGVTEMYQHLLLLAEGSALEANMYAELCTLASM
tara:strand:+ start:250 stop:729 length:480 start_codon:yes stop_codon:yes gene_type:complete